MNNYCKLWQSGLQMGGSAAVDVLSRVCRANVSSNLGAKSYRRRQSSGNCEAEHLTLNTLKITDRRSPQREHL